MLTAKLLAVAALVSVSSGEEIIVGHVRVQALSESLIRIEPRGPRGFEDNSTFSVVNRDFPGAPLSIVSQDGNTTWLKTATKRIFINQSSVQPGPVSSCSDVRDGYDISAGTRVSEYPDGISASSVEQCCQECDKLKDCVIWIYGDSHCWMMSSFSGLIKSSSRTIGGNFNLGASGVSATITDLNGTEIWSSVDTGKADSFINWPSPLSAPALAFQDRPRFFAPKWGPTPIPSDAHVDPALTATNGYDYRNDVAGDVYVFLFEDMTMDAWHASRLDFLDLTGHTPLLPDFAFGTWFTYWHSYTQAEAEGEVNRWINDSLPIDVWALDMNWRNTSNNQDHYYNHSATELFPNFTAWFEFLEARQLKTYFNDHPYPQAMQTTPFEVNFRWEGLSSWLKKGLTYWWFDANWGFSIPPPNIDAAVTGPSWEGLDNHCWGGHLYYTTVQVFNSMYRPQFKRPIVLNKYAVPNDSPGLVAHQHVAHHRYPVWWTGDGVDLQASVESMVDNGVYDFKPYLHSDCGGDSRGSSGDLLRWIAHCSFGTILRLHGAAHQPWSYDQHTEDVIRDYLDMRYKLIPSMISAGQVAYESGFPIVVRGDFFWPEYKEASSNHQYIHLNETLVAPIWNSSNNVTSRQVWVPPGSWVDAWNGSIITGPATVTVSQPYERLPMWHRQGGFLVMTADPNVRVERQSWDHLVLEAFHSTDLYATTHFVYERDSSERTKIEMQHAESGVVRFSISEQPVDRHYTIRLHLHTSQTVDHVTVNGERLTSFVVLAPKLCSEPHRPFEGLGRRPACHEGSVVEALLPHSSNTVVAEVHVQ